MTVGGLLLAAIATAVEFRLFERGTYSGTFDGASSPLWMAGAVRSLVSAVVLTGTFGALGLRAARVGAMPAVLVPLLVVAWFGTVFIGGPLPPLPGLVWLALGAWLLTDGGATVEPEVIVVPDPARAVARRVSASGRRTR